MLHDMGLQGTVTFSQIVWGSSASGKPCCSFMGINYPEQVYSQQCLTRQTLPLAKHSETLGKNAIGGPQITGISWDYNPVVLEQTQVSMFEFNFENSNKYYNILSFLIR